MITYQELKWADTKDVHDLNVILAQLSTSAKPLDLARLKEIVENENFHMCVARDGKKVIGMGSLLVWTAPTGIRSRIEDVVVDDAYRGRGIGMRLTKKLIQLAKQVRAKGIELSSRPGRVAANKLYKKMGFEQKETNVYVMKLK